MQEMQEMWVRSLGWEDPLEEEITTHSSIFAWKIPWTVVTGRPQSTGLQRVGHDWSNLAAAAAAADCSPPGSFVHGIFQAKILEWVAIFSSKGSPQPRDHTCISCIGRQILYH